MADRAVSRTAYDDRGQVAGVTSYGDPTSRDPGDVVNQIVYQHDGWGDVTQSQQAHSGAAGTGTPAVGYTYDSLSRLSSVSYPTSRTVGYAYGASGSIDNRLSRVAAITDDSSTTYAAYTYLGAGTIVKTAHPSVTSGLNLTYGTSGTYNGLDQWGRVVDQLWATDSDVVKDRYKYEYDAAGNRTKRENVVADAAGKDLSEVYAYDEIYRLIGTDRGHFSSGSFVKESDYQDWTLDGLGNFAAFNDDGTTQTREVNAANEIQAISQGTTTDLDYDAAGNLTNDGTLKYAYDAWNRLVQVKRASDNALVATYYYDGLNRRIEKKIYDLTSHSLTASTGYFYNENWQVLEEQHRDGSGTLTATDQYAWDLAYIDTPVVRFHDGNADGDHVDTVDNTLYYTTDANHNVTGLVDTSGSVLERYYFAAYGPGVVCDGSWIARADGSDANTTAGDESLYGNQVLYAGYRYDPETALVNSAVIGATGNYQVRNRFYVTMLGVFATRDPAAADENLYRYATDRATGRTDPLGLDAVAIYDQYQPQSWWEQWLNIPPTYAGSVAVWHSDATDQNTAIGAVTILPTIGQGPALYSEIALYPSYGGGTISLEAANEAAAGMGPHDDAARLRQLLSAAKAGQFEAAQANATWWFAVGAQMVPTISGSQFYDYWTKGKIAPIVVFDVNARMTNEMRHNMAMRDVREKIMKGIMVASGKVEGIAGTHRRSNPILDREEAGGFNQYWYAPARDLWNAYICDHAAGYVGSFYATASYEKATVRVVGDHVRGEATVYYDVYNLMHRISRDRIFYAGSTGFLESIGWNQTKPFRPESNVEMYFRWGEELKWCFSLTTGSVEFEEERTVRGDLYKVPKKYPRISNQHYPSYGSPPASFSNGSRGDYTTMGVVLP